MWILSAFIVCCKRGRNDFKGLTSPSKKKRRIGKKGSSTIDKPSEKPISKDGEIVVLGGTDESDNHTTATDQPVRVSEQRTDAAAVAVTANSRLHPEIASSVPPGDELGKTCASELSTSVTGLLRPVDHRLGFRASISDSWQHELWVILRHRPFVSDRSLVSHALSSMPTLLVLPARSKPWQQYYLIV